MTKDELETLNAELIEFLAELRDQINERLTEIAGAEDDPDEADESEDDD